MVQFFSNKAKGRTSKRVFQENKAPQIWHALFSWNTRFEICPFALLPTHCDKANCEGSKLDGFANKFDLQQLIHEPTQNSKTIWKT